MLQGLLTALVTPFTPEDQLDEEGLRENIRFQLLAKVDGLVPLGTTGESPTLTKKEKTRILDIVFEEVQGRIPVFPGTGSYSTKETLENTLQAKAMGADGALVITPYYNKPTQEGILRHFLTLADTADLPILIYNHPGRTGQNIHLNTLRRLASHPNIIGVKECSGSIIQMMDIVENICSDYENFSLFTGDDALLFPCLSIGGHGVISVFSNILPKPLLTILAAMSQGDLQQARAMHYSLQPLFRALSLETNPIPIKAAMKFNGLAAGACRLPLCELSSENSALLSAAFNNCVIAKQLIDDVLSISDR